ncbi:MAG: autotransporter-associated beta strand repeat-containing protein [Chthoniobacter sp.]|nr:autotransporter-associated beta strand repeat-containing protein [Chthoniobacter sp.]
MKTRHQTPTRRSTRILSGSIAAICAVALIGGSASHAVNATWNGTTDAVWATGTNWSATPVPGTGNTATFNNAGGADDVINLGSGVTIGTILFDTASAAAYTIGSGGVGIQTLTLDNGGAITVNSAVTQQEVFNANIVLGTDGTASNFTITNNRAGFSAGPYLQFSGAFTGSTGSGLKTLTFDANGTSATNSISALGNISNGTSGTVKLVKKGAGIMTLGLNGGTMTYTGGTYLDAGTLQIVGSVNNLQAGTSLYIAGGTNLNSINQPNGSYSNIAQEWNGDFSFNDSAKFVGASLQNMTFTGGTVNLGATGTDTVRTVNALANTLTIGSIISNGTNTTTTGLTKTGAGTMVLAGNNTYTGTTTVNAGTLTITGAPTGGGAYTALGSGRLEISGAAGTINTSSAIAIAGGNLQLTNTSTAEGSVNRISDSTAITANGGTLTYNNTSGNTYAENVGNVTLNGGQLNTVLSTNMATGIQTLTLNSLTQNNRSTATFSAATTAPNATNNIIKVAGATAAPAGQIIGPWATTGTSAIVQTDYAVYDASGNIVAANIAGSLDSTWTDSTKAYTSNFLGGGAGNALSAVTHNMAALRNLPAFGNTGTTTTIAIPTGGNLNTYGLLNANTNTWTINQVAGSTGALSTPTGGGSIYINTGNGTSSGNGAITIGAPINDNGGAVSIVKTGTGNSVAVGQGVLTLSNVTSNYSGATVINGGAIVLNTSGALANGGLASSLGAASTSADNLVINGGFLQYGTATTAVSTNRLFSIGAMGGTIDSSAGTTATMSFIGTGAMGFASQTGPRTLTLQGSNVGVAASTSGSNSSLSTIALLIGDNSGATSVTKTGTGTWALTNSASTYTGPTTISQGILNVGTFAAVNTASSIGMGSVAGSAADLILNGGTLQYSNNTAATTNRLFSIGTSGGALDSSAASPSNTLTFTATGAIGFNNQSGARTLTLAGTNVGANSMGLRLDDLGGLTSLTKSDKGTWALANAGNTYTGVTTINAGILSVGKLANGGVASSIGASTNADTNLVFNAENAGNAGVLGTLLATVQPSTPIALATVAPTLKYTGSGDSTDRRFRFTIANDQKTAVIDASGSGALVFTNATGPTFSTANKKLTLVLTGTSADNNTIQTVLADNGTSQLSIVKTGTGTWILSGNNTYGTAATVGDFGTTVNQGTLVLSGSPTGTVKTTVNADGTLKLDYSTNNTSKLADATGILQLGGGTLNLSGGSHAEAVTNTTLSPGASSVIQSGGGSSILRMNAITRQAGGMVDLGAASIASTTATNDASGILGAWATIGGANWALKSGTVENGSNNFITAYGAYTDIDALGSSIATGATTNVRLNTAAGSGDITLGAATTAINTLLQNTTTAATIDTTAKTLQTTGILIGDGKESLTIGLPAGTGFLQAAASAGDLVLNNASNYSGANPGKTLTVNVPIILNGASTLTTAGNVTLNGVNTYTGATFVNSGTLTIAGSGGLSGSSPITIAQGATLNYTGTANQALGTTSGFGNFIWNPSNGTAILTATRGATPAVFTIKSGIISGVVGNLGTGPASDLILDGGIIRTKDGGGGADQTSRLFTLGTGGGTIQIDDLTIPGTTTRPTEFISTGAIAFTGSGARTLKFESAMMNVNKFSPALGDGSGGATSVIMGGTAGAYGVWSLDGANTYTGTTTVNGGTLSIRKTQSVNNGVAYFTPTNITVTPGAGVAGIAIGVGAGPTYFDSTAIATILDGSHLGASTAATGLKPGAQFGLDTTAGDFTYGGQLTDLTAGTNNVFNLAKHGIGTLTLTGNNTYTGTTTIYGSGIGHGVGTSILRAGSATAFGQPTTANIVFDQGAFSLINKLQLFGNNITVIGLNSPVANHRDGSGQNIIESGSSDTSGTGTDILTINNSTTSTWNNAMALNGGISRIQDGGARRLGITKGGAGTLELGGTNTYTGGTIINAGVLRLLNTQALGGAAGAAGTVSFGAGSTGTLRLNANSITIVGLDTNATVGTPVVENGTAGNATLTVSNTTASIFAGVLQNGAAGTLLLTKTGTGTLTLSGDNTYTGATAVNGGKLVLSGNNTTATGDIAVASGAVVQFNGISSINGGAFNVSNRDVTINAGGTAVFGASFGTGIADVQTALTNRTVAGSAGTIAADNYAADPFDFAAAGLTAASLGAVGIVNYTGTLTPNGGIYRLGGGGGTLTYPTIITGSALTVTGASTGSVVLSNIGNTLGTLTMSSGVLDLNATTTQTAGSVVLSGGTLQNGTLTGTAYSGTGGTSTAVLAGSGIVFTNTSGTTTLNATNTYDGGTNITGGTLKAVAAGSLGSGLVTISNGAALALASDGTGTGLGNSKLESISYGNDIALSGAGQTITVGQFTANVGTLNAANKMLQLDTLSIGAQTLTVTNSNGFGLEFTGATTLTGATASTFSVGTANVSTAVFGLTLNGLASDGATSSANDAVILTKSGAGTLVLKGSNTTFGGNGGATGQIIDITNGYLAASTDAALGVTGATGNMVRISTNDLAKGFLATGSFSTDRTFRLNAASNGLDVTQGTTLTLTTPFSLQALGNALRKNDNGVLEISANNSTWTGVATVAAGVLKVSNAGALGTTAGNTVVSNSVGSAVQINGVSTAEPFNITGSGINSGGALENFSGTNALSGAITLGGAATIGSTSGTLTLSGGISGAQALTFSGADSIAVTTTAIGAVSSITKIGSGTTTLSAASTGFVLPFAVNAGTFKLDSAGKLGNASTTTVNPGAILTLDNTGTSTASRLGGSTRTLSLSGGTLNFIGNSTTEAIGALTPSAGLDVINLSGTGTLSFASLGTRAAGGVVSFSGSGPAVQFVATTTVTDGLLMGGTMPLFYGNDFATSTGAANAPISAYAGYATGDFGVQATSTAINFNPTGAQTNVTATKTINTLKLTGQGVTINSGQILTLDAAAVINNGGGNITGGYLITTSNAELVINNASTMSIGSVIGSSSSNFSAALTKVGAGNLTLSALHNYTGITYINQGTLTLGGGNNTLAVNKAMVLNNGGTLALGSNNQYLGSLTSTGTVEGSGGNVTGTGTLTVNTGAATFAGNIGSDSGALKFVKAGTSTTLTLVSANSTTGTVSVLGGRLNANGSASGPGGAFGLALKDGGTLAATTGITLNGAALIIDNTGTKDVADRVNNAASITLNSGMIGYYGRAQYNSTETLGDSTHGVTLNSGLNMLVANPGGATGVTSAQLTLASLTRNTGAIVNVAGDSQWNGGNFNLGQIGNAARIVVSGTQTGLTPINGVVPGAFNTYNVDQFSLVGYTSGLGFGPLGTAGFPATVSTLTGAGPTDNFVGAGGTTYTVASGGQTINSFNQGRLAFAGGTATGGDLLTISSGMMVMNTSNAGAGIGFGTPTARGRITTGAGTQELFIMKRDGNNNGVNYVNSVIENNGNPVSLIVAVPKNDGNISLSLTAANTYTGGTYVSSKNGGGLLLDATNPGVITIPYALASSGANGLIINDNSVVTMNANAGQIDPRNTVTLNGGATMTYVGNNTQANLVFNSNGGTATPTIAVGNILTLTGSITSTPTNVAVVPIISGTTLDLNNTSHNITVDGGATAASLFHAGNGATVTGLTISSAIRSLTDSSGSITKLGTGVLELITGANTFTGGLNINAGALKASSASALGGSGNVATLNNNAAIWLNATVNGGQTIVVSASGGTIASLGNNTLADNITLNGPLAISLADPTLNNTDRDITYSAAITGTGSLTVTGNANNPFNATPRSLLLTNGTSGTNTFSGGLTIGSGGRVKPSAVNNIGSLTGSLTVNTGGVLDMNVKSQTVGNFTGTGGQVTSATAATLTIGNGNGGGGNYAGIFSGVAQLTKVGTGTITLSGSSTSTGDFTVADGTLALDFTTATTANPVWKSGSGQLFLSGGTLDLRNGSSQVQAFQAGGGTTLTGGLSNVTQSTGGGSAGTVLRMDGITPGVGVVNFGADNIASTTALNNGAGILGGWATVGGTDWATRSATVESGTNNYIVALTGGAYTDIDAQAGGASPDIVDGSTTNVRIQTNGVSGAIGLSAATTTVGTLLQNNATTAATVDTATKALVTSGIMIGSGKEALTIGVVAGDGSLKSATAGTALSLINNNASKTLIVNAPILVNGASGLATAGNVLLNGVNTYTGNTGVGSGTLEIGGAGQLQSGTYAGAIQISGSGIFKYNSSANQTLNGVISGLGGLVKDGASTLTLNTVNTYTGGTIVNGGILSLPAFVPDNGSIRGELTLNNASKATFPISLGYSAPENTLATININNGSTLEFTGGGNATFTGVTVNMTGGNWTQTNPTGKYDLFQIGSYGQGAINTLASATTSEISARLSLRSYTPVFTVADGAANVDLLVSGAILFEGGFGITKAGSGVMALTSTGNTYTGQTTISAGTLQLGNNTTTGSLLPASALVNNATLAFNRTNTLTQGADFNSVISGTGAVLQKGTGTTVLNGSNTYTGTTTIANGTLSASSVVVSGGASNLGNATSAVVLGDATNKGTLSYTGNSATFTRGFSVDAGGGQIDTTTSGQTLTIATGGITSIAANTSLTIAGAGDTTITAPVALGAASGALTKDGAGLLNINSGAQTYKTLTATAGAGTTNVNVALTATGNTDVVASANVKFGSVSQTLSSLTIGAGATVTFTSGVASGSLTGGDGGGKLPAISGAAPSFGGSGTGGSAVVPEPGTVGLLLVGALGLLNRRRRQSKGRGVA